MQVERYNLLPADGVINGHCRW